MTSEEQESQDVKKQDATVYYSLHIVFLFAQELFLCFCIFSFEYSHVCVVCFSLNFALINWYRPNKYDIT